MRKILIFWVLKVTLVIGFLTTFFSCVPREKIVYFQGNLDGIGEAADKYSAIIQPDDILEITVFARDQNITKYFNQESNVPGNLTYLVDEEGYIEFPVLGRIKMAGMSRIEAIAHMKELLKGEAIDPSVSLKILNYKITILGEVGNPGTYTLENEKTTLLEALGMAGDLTINGIRNNVMVIREEGGQRNFYRVDLTSSEVFNSPVYYLAQNDVIYVEPNKSQINSTSSLSKDLGVYMSVVSFLMTIVVLLTR